MSFLDPRLWHTFVPENIGMKITSRQMPISVVAYFITKIAIEISVTTQKVLLE